MSLNETEATKEPKPGSKPDALRRWAELERRAEHPQVALRLEEAADEIERLRALVEELRWQRDHALQCVECAEMGDGCGEIATRMLASGERSAE